MRAGAALLLALATGCALALAFPEPDLAPLAWVAMSPLLVLVAGTSARRALLLGFAFGLGFFGLLLYWISVIGWVAWGLLVVLQASFVALFGLAWSGASRRAGWVTALVAPPVLWVAAEYLRSILPLRGFTWGQLAQSQHDLAWMLRPASLAGGWVVAALLLLVNAAIARAFIEVRAGRARRAIYGVAVAVVVIAAPALMPAPDAQGRALRVAIVQGDVPEGFASPFERELAIVRSHARLTEGLASRQPDLVVWPESSVGLDLERIPAAAELVRRSALAVDAPMIIGGNLDVGTDRYLVMAFHVSSSGRIVERYQKTHLVPFGEYVPARGLLDWIPMLEQVPRDAIAGDVPVLFEIAGGKVAPVISFEGDFGSLVRERTGNGGRLLVVATNTSTWGSSWASAQHVAFSQVRAAENGIWVVHAAITGISGFVAPDGRVVARTALGEATSAVATVRFAEGASLYARTGDWFALGCVVLSAGFVLAGAVAPSPRARD